jgi:hypothetical protein
VAFFRKGHNKKFNFNKFKQNKPIREKRKWIVTPIVNRKLLSWSTKVTKRVSARYKPLSNQGTVKELAKQKRLRRKRSKLRVKYRKALKKAVRRSRKLIIVKYRKALKKVTRRSRKRVIRKLKQLAYFFPKPKLSEFYQRRAEKRDLKR